MTDDRASQRPRRADARDNRERILRAARAAFAEHGPRASLNRIGAAAGVGAGTLYRHFPSEQALLVEIIRADVDALCATGRDLADEPDAAGALRDWLRAVARHATAMRGLVATHMATVSRPGTDATLAACHDAIRATGAILLNRARNHGAAPPTVDIGDLLTLANALAWASEQAADDPGLLDRLLDLALAGLDA
ncbi:TetR/AcrR family transcriptional regulator [Frankia sp. AiPs1]|uniref:TetR/AcrR family transcriptional regulator n=1 Tax=Frankia sp. AiPs1 TaxID=573493 RepID=UPI002042E6B6|nr:TetR/AcrR family transcriptional regulator [Frankia sp. AiPs1]MCM3925735.1 TetR/AcrR family transcriptional regulator [Frankia sp. AiPs1]